MTFNTVRGSVLSYLSVDGDLRGATVVEVRELIIYHYQQFTDQNGSDSEHLQGEKSYTFVINYFVIEILIIWK